MIAWTVNGSHVGTRHSGSQPANAVGLGIRVYEFATRGERRHEEDYQHEIGPRSHRRVVRR